MFTLVPGFIKQFVDLVGSFLCFISFLSGFGNHHPFFIGQDFPMRLDHVSYVARVLV